jgi:hypothetical protein
MKRTWALALLTVVTSGSVLSACMKTSPRVRALGDGLDVRTIPVEYRADYELFAQRCSKCHSLSRPLDNGRIEDRFWASYVERMRRQPGSGISPEEVPSILRFLHFYSTEVVADGEPASQKEPKEVK